MTEVDQALEDQIKELHEIMSVNFSSDRYEKLTRMYNDYGNALKTAPASSKLHYHNCFPGGYLNHILNVYNCALEQLRSFKKMGATIDFTKSELTMVALHHDLWKLGVPGGEPYYVPQTSDWHKNNQGEHYKHNEKLPFMKVADGGLFVLQMYGIELTQTEWISIKIHDGLYENGNDSYLRNYNTKFAIRSSLPYILHWADHMATEVERQSVKFDYLSKLT